MGTHQRGNTFDHSAACGRDLLFPGGQGVQASLPQEKYLGPLGAQDGKNVGKCNLPVQNGRRHKSNAQGMHTKLSMTVFGGKGPRQAEEFRGLRL